MIISERSCDPAHEFIIFIAKASCEGFELHFSHAHIMKIYRYKDRVWGITNKHHYHMSRKIFFAKNIIDEPFLLFGHKCVRLANSEDLDEMTHFIRVYTVCYKYEKGVHRERNVI